MAPMLKESMPVSIRIPWLKRMLKMPMVRARSIDTMAEAVLLSPIMPGKTLKVLDMSTKKRAVKIPRVLTAKLEITKEARNSLPGEAPFSVVIRYPPSALQRSIIF